MKTLGLLSPTHSMLRFLPFGALAVLAGRLFLVLSLLLGSIQIHAGSREQARRIHDRLAGVPPTDTVLALMEQYIDEGK